MRTPNRSNDQIIISLAKAGWTKSRIHKEGGYSLTTIKRVMQEHDIVPRDEQKKILSVLWYTPLNNTEIGTALNCTPGRITERARQNGLPHRRIPKPKVPDEVVAQIVAYRKSQRATIPMILDKFPVGWGTVQRILERNGLSRLIKEKKVA